MKDKFEVARRILHAIPLRRKLNGTIEILSRNPRSTYFHLNLARYTGRSNLLLRAAKAYEETVDALDMNWSYLK